MSTSSDFLASIANGRNVQQVNPVFADKITKLIQAAEAATGAKVQLNSGYRSGAEQAQLYANTYGAITYDGTHYTPKGPSSRVVADPRKTTTPHMAGMAVDIQPTGAAYQWMVKHASDYGVEWGGSWKGSQNDPPHFQLPRGEWSEAERASVPVGSPGPTSAPPANLAMLLAGDKTAASVSPLDPPMRDQYLAGDGGLGYSASPATPATTAISAALRNPPALPAPYGGSALTEQQRNAMLAVPSLPSAAPMPTISNSQQASDFYSGFGLQPAGSPPPLPYTPSLPSVPPDLIRNTFASLDPAQGGMPPGFNPGAADRMVSDTFASLNAPSEITPDQKSAVYLPPAMTAYPSIANGQVTPPALPPDLAQDERMAGSISPLAPPPPIMGEDITPNTASAAPTPMDRLRVTPEEAGTHALAAVNALLKGTNINLAAVPPNQQLALIQAVPVLLGMQNDPKAALNYLQGAGLYDPLMKVVPTHAPGFTERVGAGLMGVNLPPMLPNDPSTWGVPDLPGLAGDLNGILASAPDAFRRSISDADGVTSAPAPANGGWPVLAPAGSPPPLPSTSGSGNRGGWGDYMRSPFPPGLYDAVTTSGTSGVGGPSIEARDEAATARQNLPIIAAIHAPPLPGVPRYVDVQKRVPVPASDPIETGDGVHWDANLAQFVMDGPAAIGTTYRNITVKAPNPAWHPDTVGDRADELRAASPPPVTLASGSTAQVGQTFNPGNGYGYRVNPDGSTTNLTTGHVYGGSGPAATPPPIPSVPVPSAGGFWAAPHVPVPAAPASAPANPLQSFFNNTPLGHLTGLLTGAPASGGLLGLLAAPHSTPLGALLGGAAAPGLLTPAQQYAAASGQPILTINSGPFPSAGNNNASAARNMGPGGSLTQSQW